MKLIMQYYANRVIKYYNDSKNIIILNVHHAQGHDQGRDQDHDQDHDQGHDHDQGRVWAWSRDPAPLIVIMTFIVTLIMIMTFHDLDHDLDHDKNHPCVRHSAASGGCFSGK